MKLEDHFSFILVCPLNDTQRLTKGDVHYSSGVCPICGHDNNCTITHYKKIIGKWNRANIFEFLIGIKSEFVPWNKIIGKFVNE